MPPALTRAAAARHTRTGAGSGGPPGHSGALFSAVHENPPFRDHPKMNYVKCAVLKDVGWLMRGATSVLVIQMRSGAFQLRARQKYH